MIIRTPSKILLMSLALTACNEVPGGSSGGDPSADLGSGAAIPADSVREKLALLSDRLTNHSLRWRTGDSPEDSLDWGLIVGATEDTSGNLIILDGLAPRIVRLSTEGDILKITGRAGRGPLELHSPIGIASGGNGEILLAQRNEILVLDGNLEAEKLRITALPSIFGICGLSDKAYVQINSPSLPDNQAAVIEIEPGADPHLVSAPSLPRDLIERVELTQGYIVCSPEAGRFVVAYRNLQFVHAFTPDGHLAWERQLDPFTAAAFERVDFGGLAGARFDRSKPNDTVLSLVAIPGGALLVQVARLSAAAGRERQVLRRDSYLFHAVTGDHVYVGDLLPPIVYATDELLLAFELDDTTLTPFLGAYAY